VDRSGVDDPVLLSIVGVRRVVTARGRMVYMPSRTLDRFERVLLGMVVVK